MPFKQAKKDTWIFMWSQTPFMVKWISTAKALKERPDVYPARTYFAYFDGYLASAYMREDDLDRLRNESARFLDREYFESYQKRYHKEREGWWRWIRLIEKKEYGKSVSNGELANDIHRFVENDRDAIAYFGSTRTEFTYATERELERVLRKRERTAPTSFVVLATATEPDDIQKEYQDWLKLVSGSVPREDALLRHLSRYPWLVFGELDEKKALAYLMDRIGQEKRKMEVETADTAVKSALKSEQEEILESLGKGGARARFCANVLQTQSVERMNIKSYWAGSYYLARNLWLEVARRLSIATIELLSFVTGDEIADLLGGVFTGSIEKIIEDRKKAFAIEYEQGSDIRILGSSEAKSLYQKRIVAAPSTDVIKGQPASLGVRRGVVRKVVISDLETLKEDIKRFREGEVLVTSMTQPNMMVIAERAGAIVTDEGGITSHAAIISRELKIPCIVGCMHAMQVLKDGDLVEVDAERGVVTIIKKNNE